MINHFCKKPLWEVSRKLARVASGVESADTVIKNARLINVCTREIIPDIQVAVSEGRIALVGDASACIGENTKVIDAEGRYIAPGFLDGHIHIESSMMTVREYARAVIPHGTTGIYMDPHEICNVLGLPGVKCMLEEAEKTPLKAMLTAPSCVPAVPGFEDTGASVGPEDIAEVMKWDSCVGLGEMMNFPGIISADERTHAIVGETLKAGKTVTGHYSMPETGPGLNAYIASGVRCCHESTREIDSLAKMRLGMYAMLREGSAWHDLREVIKAVTRHDIDSRFGVMISDDTHPETLIASGHMDHIVRRAVVEGLDPITAIQMVTINCAQCFQMDHELGSITPGKCADIVFINNLEELKVERVMIDGDIVAENGRLCVELPAYDYPDWAVHTMHVKNAITPDSFKISAGGREGSALARVIEIIPARVGTYERQIALPVVNGFVEASSADDVLKAAVFERHHETGTAGFGFVKGFGIRGGAMASTVAHDAHNLLVVGDNDGDMSTAANALVECGGGIAVASGGKVLARVPLPVAGLMSTLPCSEMVKLIEKLTQAWVRIGCTLPSPFMTMSLLALACLPELRLTNRGLVDCRTFNFTDLLL
ncbi:MAG: adenine deaminase [Oscillospiraceae bacterium]|nr:adenine deaminase [Oscillospiraceae bacterium]